MTQRSKTSAKRGRPALTPAQMEAQRVAIAAAARRLFKDEGYAAVSIRRVANAAGMTPMTFYTYFDSKVDVLRYLWSDVFEALFDSLDELAEREHDRRERLRRICVAYVQYWIANPDHYRMVFMSDGVSQPEVSVFVAQDSVAVRFGVFGRSLGAAADLDPAAAEAETQLLVCALHGIAHNHITIGGYPWQSPATLVDTLISALVPLQNRATPKASVTDPQR
jgi:AcrR family transcriptional regulator